MSMPESCPLCSRRNEVHSHSQQPREAPGYSIAQEVPHLRRSVFGKDPFATLYKGGGEDAEKENHIQNQVESIEVFL